MEDSKKSGRDTLWKILVCVALLVFLVSGGLTLRSYLADKRAQEEYERLAREAAQTTQETITIEETEKQELETEPEKEEYQSPYDFDTLKKENPDTIGWIHIPDTKISYPIVQGTDNDFYLKHDFNGEASVAGSIYLYQKRSNGDSGNCLGNNKNRVKRLVDYGKPVHQACNNKRNGNADKKTVKCFLQCNSRLLHHNRKIIGKRFYNVYRRWQHICRHELHIAS